MTRTLPQDIKKMNSQTIQQVFQKDRVLTKKDIADRSGLSIVTVNKLVKELEEDGTLLQTADPLATGGRKTYGYYRNPENKLILVIQLLELGGDPSYLFSVINLAEEIKAEFSESGLAMSYEKLLTFIRKILAAYSKIAVIVLGVPGIEVNGELKIMDFPLLADLHLKESLAADLKRKVLIENDINAAAYGYAAPQENSVGTTIGIYYPIAYPPGSGIVINGEIYRGKNNFAGEVKYIPLGIDWERERKTAALKTNIQATIQSVISLYDPHEIVLYSELPFVGKAYIRQLTATIKASLPAIDLPEITISHAFRKDYQTGLIKLGLANLTV